ncbi:Receptor like protein [Actinidia chinensis var. chinensis]|uniref:Receptor like protein n=1 Tax=Actinidia chinensis var. chinensis TaxID=1590841 RepID=A0A2R6PLS7_ACTCC|nr:Receptor like protein [Actinidia chinensis var. chinensis]
METMTLFRFLKFLAISPFHICFSYGIGSSKIMCLEIERQTLVKFKHDLKDPSNRLSSWAVIDCCQWTGVVCDNFTGHVHEIHLRYPYCHPDSPFESYGFKAYSRLKLGGRISSSSLDLKHLRHLDLSCNDFGGIQMPSFIDSLMYLNLSGAGFSV